MIILMTFLIESAVEMEAAYYDFVTESCQIKFQEISESASVEALNEGVIDAIKNFFKKIWNAITKLFGGSGSSSGGISTLCTVLAMLVATHRRTIQGIKKQIKLTVKKAVKANN